MSLYKIAVISCYYGRLPWYFKFFVNSVAHNPDVDFMLVTDEPIHIPLPPNLIIVNRSLEDLEKMAHQQFNFPVDLSNPYKLCDLKPAYGLLFSELLKTYDFWGHADIDIIYGNIRRFITDDILQHHDLISVRPEYITGFFALFRNNERMRMLFKFSKDFRKVFQSPDHYCFDECNFCHLPLLQGQSIFSLTTEIHCMTRVAKDLAHRGIIRAYFNNHVLESLPGEMEWNNGHLFHKQQQEILLYHLIDFKRLPYLSIPSWGKIPLRFFIHPFYITQAMPVSFNGKLQQYLLEIPRLLKKRSLLISQYIRWAIQYLTASRKIHPGSANMLPAIEGMYAARNQYMSVFIENGNVYIRIEGIGTHIRLLHIKGNEFLVSKFNIASFINTRVRFDCNKQPVSMHIIPNFLNTLVLKKVS